MELPPEYAGLSVDEKQKYVRNLQKDVLELQETLEDLRRSAPTNVLSQAGMGVMPYPPVVHFKSKKTLKLAFKHRILMLRGFEQVDGYRGLATVFQNGTVVLWDANTGLKYESFNIGKGSMMSLGINSNGSLLAAGGLSCCVEIYSIGTRLREMTGNELSLKLRKNEFDAGNTSTSGRPPQYNYSLSGHDGAVNAISFFDETSLVSGAQDRTIVAWDVPAGEPVTETYDTAPITSLDTSKSLYASTNEEGMLKVWDLRERNGHAQTMRSPAALNNCKFMPEGKSILTSTRTGLYLFDLRSNSVLETYRFKGGTITTMDISASGRLAVVGTDSGYLIPVDLFQNRWFPPIDKRKDKISGTVIQMETIYSSSWDGTVKSYSYNQ